MTPISQVFNEDCVEGMKRFPDKFFDLAIVDPPYGLPKDSVHSRGKLKDRAINRLNMSWDVAPNQNYFTELLRVSKNQIIWGGNYFDLPPTRCVLVWDKCQPWVNFSQIELAWTSFQSPAQLFKLDNRNGDKIHPTQKPIALYNWIIEKYTKIGFKIIDTHLGSQSSRIAAYKKGFDFWGFEIDEDYFREGNERFKKETALPLFDNSESKLIQHTIF